MNTAKKYTILALIIATISGACWLYNRDTSPNYVAMADKITTNVEKKLTKRYPMQVIGVSAGMMNKVNTVGLRFQIRGPLTKERLREILVDSVEEFLSSINEDEEIRPFLKNYPFTENEIDILISVVDESGIRVYDPNIDLVMNARGKIFYYTRDPDVAFKDKQEIEEDYQTALQIVQESKQP